MSPIKVTVTPTRQGGVERERTIEIEAKWDGLADKQDGSFTSVCRVPGGEIVARARDYLRQSYGDLALRPDDYTLKVGDKVVARVPGDDFKSGYRRKAEPIHLVTVDTGETYGTGPKATVQGEDHKFTIEVFRPKRE